MKKMLSILTAALFAFGAVSAFADDLPDLYPAPPLAEKTVKSAPKHKKVHKAKKIQKAKKAGKAQKAGKKKARKVSKTHR